MSRPFAGALAGILIALPLAHSALAQVVVPTGFVDEQIVGGLDRPSAFAFLPDGRVLLVEQRSGKVRMVVEGHLAATDPVFTVTDVNIVGMERGLLGIAVDPAWPARPYVYLYYNRTGNTIRIVRYTATGDLANPSGENFGLTTPRDLISDLLDDTIYHQAGCMRFGPDGMLYASLGDDAYDCLAYDKTSLHGAMVRLDVDSLPAGGGTQVTRASITPDDNPFLSDPSANAKLVWAYGLRNPFRFQVDPVTGLIYCGDVGEDTYEELDEIRAGDYLGWPYREAYETLAQPTCPEPGGPGAVPFVGPIAYFGRDNDAHAIISAGMYRPVTGAASNWPSLYHPLLGDVFYTDYYVGDLYRLRWNGSSWSRAPEVPGQPSDSTWGAGFSTASDFLVGPDGSLWWLRQFDDSFGASTGTLRRVRFTGTVAVEGAERSLRPLRAVPNPSAATVELSFRLESAERVRLTVHDVAGRRVATLLDGEASPGETRVRWSGQDTGGRVLAAGVYFARLERPAPAPAQTVRMLRGR